VLVDVAVMLADRGECISDIATLADRADLFSRVGRTRRVGHMLDSIGAADLDTVTAHEGAVPGALVPHRIARPQCVVQNGSCPERPHLMPHTARCGNVVVCRCSIVGNRRQLITRFLIGG
jgi:hypothetical protein